MVVIWSRIAYTVSTRLLKSEDHKISQSTVDKSKKVTPKQNNGACRLQLRPPPIPLLAPFRWLKRLRKHSIFFDICNLHQSPRQMLRTFIVFSPFLHYHLVSLNFLDEYFLIFGHNQLRTSVAHWRLLRTVHCCASAWIRSMIMFKQSTYCENSKNFIWFYCICYVCLIAFAFSVLAVLWKLICLAKFDLSECCRRYGCFKTYPEICKKKENKLSGARKSSTTQKDKELDIFTGLNEQSINAWQISVNATGLH